MQPNRLTDAQVHELPAYSKARMTPGELYVLKTNPHDAQDIAVHSPQLLSNNMPDHCQMIEAVTERTYVASSVTVDNLPEIMSQRGHAPSFNSSSSPLANPLRPARRQIANTSNADVIDNEFMDDVPPPQTHVKTEEQLAEERKQAELEEEIRLEKEKAAALAAQERKNKQQQQSGNKRQSGKGKPNQTSLDGVEI